MLAPYIFRFYYRNYHMHRHRRKYVITLLILSSVLLTVLIRFRFLNRRYFQIHFEGDSWLIDPLRACDDNFIAYGHQFVWLKHSKYIPERQSFQVPCRTEIPSYWFYYGSQGTPYKDLKAKLSLSDSDVKAQNDATNMNGSHVTFAVWRVESHNLFHTMCEWYNIYLLTKLFNLEISTVDILIMDSRPETAMDPVWKTLFSTILRHDVIPSDTVFQNLVWIPIGYESPLHYYKLDKVPYMEEFHRFFTSSFGSNNSYTLNCTRLTYTVILRHDYVSHPERLADYDGRIHRKFKNENEVLSQIRNTVGQRHTVRGVVLEEMSMREQLKLMSETDVLIGIHGAGLMHIVSLPRHATVLELRPYSIERHLIDSFHHFRALSRYRGIRYVSWTSDNTNDSIGSFSMEVPLTAISELVRNINNLMC